MSLQSDNGTFAAIAGPVARMLLGDPNKALSSKSELRFGNRGSLSVDLKTGQIYDHSEAAGGGVLWLIERQKGLKGREAIEWLKSSGFDLPDNRPALSDNRKPQSANPSANIANSGEKPRPKIAKTYDYVDESGALVFQVVRFEPKDFRQRRRAGPMDDPAKVRDGWVWSVKDVRQVPYRLPDVIEAISNGYTIMVVEGEKDADNLWARNIPATCNAMGAGKWPEELTRYFEDADVVILPDNDEPGRAHRDMVGKSLTGVAKRVRVLDVPVRAEKEDVSDWLSAGGTPEALYDLLDEKGREWKEPTDKPFASRYGRLAWADLDKPGPEHEYLIDDFLTAADKSVIGGPSKSGKSFLAIHASLAVARGTKFFGRPVQKGLVVYQAGEGARGIKKRLRAYRQYFGVPKSEDVPFELLQSAIDLWRPDGDTGPLIAEIKAIAAMHADPLRLVVIDTLATAIGGADEISGKDMGAVMKNISRINSETGAHVMLVHHMNAEGKKLRGHTSIYANLDQVIFVTRNEETKVRKVVLDKQKDDEDGVTFSFELLSMEIGTRDDGRPITSCVVVEPGEKAKAIEDRAKKQGFKLRPQEVLVFKALMAAISKHGEQAPGELELPLGARVVAARHWKSEFEAIAPYETGDDSEQGQARRAASVRQALKRAGEVLLRFGVIGRREPFIWWTGKPVADFPETFGSDGLPPKRDQYRSQRDETPAWRDENPETSDGLGGIPNEDEAPW